MNTVSETIHSQSAHSSTLKWAAGGSAMEAFGAIAAMALAIVGLAGIFSATLAAIATIVLGAAILLQSGSYGISRETVAEAGSMETGMRSGGLSAEFLGGITGVVLGILSLLGVDPVTLLSVALIVFGASFLLGSFSAVDAMPLMGAGGGSVLMGLGAVVLGILAVVGTAPLTLVLAGLLALGTHALFNGTNFGARARSFPRRY